IAATAGPPLAPVPAPAPSAAVPRRLRVGYLSHDFRDHPIAHLIAGVLERHDRSRIEVAAYAYGPPDHGPHRARIAAAVGRFVDIDALGHRAAAERIRADGIDILVDLTGPTFGGRMQIAALRPAPVQVWYLGYPGTTGARFFDYVISDAIATPTAIADGFTEALVHLPHLFQAPVASELADPPARAHLGLPADAFMFASFNQPAKLDPLLFACWMRILARTPAAVLWLYADPPVVADRLRDRAAAAGLDRSRLVASPRVPVADHLARIAAADLVLDTGHFNGGTTTSQVLGAGVPVLAIAGRSFAARMSASLLFAAGLADCVLPDLSAYEACAVALGNDRPAAAAIRSRLAAARATAPLFDLDQFVRDLEAAYAAMWASRVAGLQPAPIALAPD
ncbi:MAG: glycosyltransferase, partial [Alphaproteobacteria bacterium]|nr:glycosyltransferase [Alphaproteobacteria bacterium]